MEPTWEKGQSVRESFSRQLSWRHSVWQTPWKPFPGSLPDPQHPGKLFFVLPCAETAETPLKRPQGSCARLESHTGQERLCGAWENLPCSFQAASQHGRRCQAGKENGVTGTAPHSGLSEASASALPLETQQVIGHRDTSPATASLSPMAPKALAGAALSSVLFTVADGCGRER